MYDYSRQTRTAAAAAYGKESLNTFFSNISWKALAALKATDEKFIGTPDYMGLAYFWAMAYKFELRDASTAQRRAVHEAFLKEGLDLDGVSPEHEAIVAKLT